MRRKGGGWYGLPAASRNGKSEGNVKERMVRAFVRPTRAPMKPGARMGHKGFVGVRSVRFEF